MPLNTQSTLAQPWLKLTLISPFVFISDNPSDFSSGRTFYSCWFDGKLFKAQWVKCKLYNYFQFVKWWVTMYFSWCYLYQRFLYKLIFCCFCCSCVFFFTWLLSWKRHVRWIRRYVFVDRFSENVTGLTCRRHVNPEAVGSNPTLVNSLFNPKNHFKIYPVSFPCGLY